MAAVSLHSLVRTSEGAMLETEGATNQIRAYCNNSNMKYVWPEYNPTMVTDMSRVMVDSGGTGLPEEDAEMH